MLSQIIRYGLALSLITVAACDGGGGDDGAGTGTDSVTATDTVPSTSADTADGTMTTPTSPDTGEDDGGECGVGGQCSPPVPEDWFGPVVFMRGAVEDELPPCSEDFPESSFTLLEGYADPGPADCDCACTVNVEALCSTTAQTFSDDACTTFEGFVQIPGGCEDIPVNGSANIFMSQIGEPMCVRESMNEFPEPDWDAKVFTCRIDDDEEPAECATGICTGVPPEGFDTNLCVFAQGSHDCPGGDYTEKFTWFSGAEDDRRCTGCECGLGTATCDGATIQFFAGQTCGGAMVAEGPPAMCLPVVGAQSIGKAFPGDNSCPVEVAPMPEGEIAPTGEFTYCCQA